ISGVTRSMLGVAVPVTSELQTLADLVEAAKANPKGLDFGNFATGYRLATAWFATQAGLEFTDIPYTSTVQMNTDLMSAQMDVAMDGVASLTASVKSSKLRLRAVTGAHRHHEFPEVPTFQDSGFPDLAVYGWSALMVREEPPEDVT